ncbi:MAG: TIGR00730 family Rossman fold protein [Bacteroidaceae bacterium]|nr:TIGR00730 family Rossman fold protein [Bacteroidaceae bacterium]
MKRIGVFCSANENIRRSYFDRTTELGAYIGQRGHQLVFGGCNMGLMECIARAVKENGGTTLGIVPNKIEEYGAVSKYTDEIINVNSLGERKEKMTEVSDVIIALPGGLGTLDEIFSVVASTTIGYYDKKVILYNIEGFWDELISLLQDLQDRNFIRGRYTDFFLVATNLEQLKNII